MAIYRASTCRASTCAHHRELPRLSQVAPRKLRRIRQVVLLDHGWDVLHQLQRLGRLAVTKVQCRDGPDLPKKLRAKRSRVHMKNI